MNYKSLFQKMNESADKKRDYYKHKSDLRKAKWGRCGYCETPLFDPMNPEAHSHMDFCGPYCENASRGKGIPSMVI